MSEPASAFPTPRLTEWNHPYFKAAEAGRLVLQRCNKCRKLNYYPRIACANCLSTELKWEEVEGRGTVYSFSIVWRPQHPSFEPYLPIIMVAVELTCGILMIASLVDSEAAAVEIGMPVEVCFGALGDGPVLPRFREPDR
jgi:uncharacterized OB-fold protein